MYSILALSIFAIFARTGRCQEGSKLLADATISELKQPYSGVDCSSLNSALDSLSGVEDSDVSTTAALLQKLGFTDEIISQAGSALILLPTNSAWEQLSETLEMPISNDFIMTNQDKLKQIFLHHLSDGISEDVGSVTVNTALSKLPELAALGFIDTDAICGQMDSQYIKLEYNTTDGVTFTEPIGKHYSARAIATVCNIPTFHVLTVDTVMTPCPLDTTLAGDTGCMTVAAAVAQLPNHILGALPYSLSDASLVSMLKHPNALLMNQLPGATVFLPSATTLAGSAAVSALGSWPATGAMVDVKLSADGETTSVPQSFMDMISHIVGFHVADGLYLVGDADATLNTLAENAYCLTGEEDMLMVDDMDNANPGVVSTVAGQKVAISEINNNVVCGGYLHVIEDVIAACPVEDYLPKEEDTTDQGGNDAGAGEEQPVGEETVGEVIADGVEQTTEDGATSSAYSARVAASAVALIVVAAALA